MTYSAELLECPLCEYRALPSDDYVMQLHFEQVHTEDSPFKIEDDPEPLPPPLPARPSPVQTQQDDQDIPSGYVACPQPDCGEVVLLTDFNYHLDLHTGELLSSDETSNTYHQNRKRNMHHYTNVTYPSDRFHGSSLRSPDSDAASSDTGSRHHGKSKHRKRSTRKRGDSNSSEKSTLSRSIMGFNPLAKLNKAIKPPPNPTRLGRSELGPHAWEERMPKWLHEQLAAGPKITTINRIGRDGRLIKQERVQNETPGLIPILAQLSALDRTVKEAYYCHPATVHIGKTPKEGSFCGYRNIQMLISYIQGTHAQGHEEFPGRTPGILELQELIERAWDKGINEIGRAQTGGIRGTRKYIGTPEAQALFLSSEIDCAVEMFTDSRDGRTEAHEHLLLAVEAYFAQAAIKDDDSNVYKTLLPPIYLQQPGHSLTIVGLEYRKDGTRNLVIFDPTYHTCPAMHRLLGRKNLKTFRPEVMYNYRRESVHLRKLAAFEILMLTAHPPMFPAWDVLRQFPGCRFLYAFFRSMTLGYDVYPEDHFLRHFPWWQYGGLWIVDDARFATTPRHDHTKLQALRRITSAGSSIMPTLGSGSEQCSAFTSEHFHSPNMHSLTPPGLRFPVANIDAKVPPFDGSQSNTPLSSPIEELLRKTGMCRLNTGAWDYRQQSFGYLQPSGDRYPGYFSPLSPTASAKEWFPSPIDNLEGMSHSSLCATPKLPLNLCGRGFSNISQQASSEPSVAPVQMNPFVPDGFIGNFPNVQDMPLSPSLSTVGSIGSPMSTAEAVSPRVGMLRGKANKQRPYGSPNYQLCGLSHQDNQLSPFYSSHNGNASSLGSSSAVSLHTPLLTPPSSLSSVQIANGTETYIGSPISPFGLVYKSHRPACSGLLGLPALSETKVAEYRFWMPCGKKNCGIGCADKDAGELAAARRLFKSEEQVMPCTDE